MIQTLLMTMPQGGNSSMMTFVGWGLIMVVFYFFMIRPQQTKAKTEEKFRTSIKKGTRIVTVGGMHGKIIEEFDKAIVLEIESGAKMRVERSAISLEYTKAAYPEKTITPDKIEDKKS